MKSTLRYSDKKPLTKSVNFYRKTSTKQPKIYSIVWRGKLLSNNIMIKQKTYYKLLVTLNRSSSSKRVNFLCEKTWQISSKRSNIWARKNYFRRLLFSTHRKYHLNQALLLICILLNQTRKGHSRAKAVASQQGRTNLGRSRLKRAWSTIAVSTPTWRCAN